VSKHSKAELLGIVLRLEAIMTERTLSSVMEVNNEGKAECASGYSVLGKDELRLREAIRLRTERLRAHYLGKIAHGELVWDAEVYNLMMDDMHMEKVIINHMTRKADTWSEVNAYHYTDGRPEQDALFVRTGIQNVKGEASGVFYHKETKLVQDTVFVEVRQGHDPDNPKLLGTVEPKRAYWGKDELEEDLVLEEAIYGPSDPRTPTLEETTPEREYPADWLWIPEVPPTVVAKPRKYQSDRILRDAGIAAWLIGAWP
jgi:hypothetical protein